MLTIWSTTASQRKWATRAVVAAMMAALAFSGMAMTSQAQAEAGVDKPVSVRWR